MSSSAKTLAGSRVRPVFETAILVACAGALLLPHGYALATLVGLLLLWLAARAPRHERLFVALSLGLAVILILASVGVEHLGAPTLEEWTADVETGFERLWDDLANAAERAAAGFAEAPQRGGLYREEFAALEHWIRESPAGSTLMLVDPDGAVTAWAGEGLLHEIEPLVTKNGFDYRLGYGASTMLAVEPIDDSPRPWRLVAARSLVSNRLPVRTRALTQPGELRWFFGGPREPTADGDLRLKPGEAAPSLFVEKPRDFERRPRNLASILYRLGELAIGLTLLALVLLRTSGSRLLPEGTARRSPPGIPLLAMAGTAALGIAANFQGPLTVALAASVGLATWGLLRQRPRGVRPGAGSLGGALALVGLALAAYFYQVGTGAEDLVTNLSGGADSFALCLVWCLSALGLLVLAARRAAPSESDRAAWWATALLLAAAATCDFPWLGLTFLALAGAAITRWLLVVDLGERPGALAGLLVLSALAGSVSWEIAYREVFRQEIGNRYLTLIGPPSLDERNALHQELYSYFAEHDFSRLLIAAQGEIDTSDLAFVLWKDSPLAERDALSAIEVETRDGRRSAFSFGLSYDDELGFTLPPDRKTVPRVNEWQSAMVFDRVELRLGERVLGTVSYWLLPRPGFRLEVNELDELEQALIRGGPSKRALDGLPRGVLYALYDADRRAVSSPWGESPPLTEDESANGKRARAIDTPSGRSWYWRAEGEDGTRCLYLPQLTPRDGLERVGIHALGSLAWIAALALVTLIVALPRGAWRNLFESTIRSYSKRMILVYVVLLLVPLIALNLILMQSFVDRERSERRENAQGALSAARTFVLDYLRGLEPGFDLETQINRALMEFIAGVVDHPVNFYWGSRVFASSQQELFVAGLMPRRIPGAVFSRLALRGYEMDVRRHEVEEARYLELYAPLDIGGTSAATQGLFLSVPLLEQEEDDERQLETLRRRAVLVTSALVILLVAVGSRLARSFTKPLMEIIAGTREIAAGAPFLQATPRESELEALADAIDDMARRIAEGRRKLLLEKQVVERIVDNISSGVVSLDHNRRVLLQNRVAADRLGSAVGAGLQETLEGDDVLRPVLEFLADAGSENAQRTVELRQDGEVREWTLTWVPIPGTEDPAALLVVDDSTEVLRGQRLEAWAEMARIIAHEIKNPLTPIRLSADHMRQVYQTDRERFDEVFERCISNILKQVAELADIASDFSIYSRIPRAELAPGDLTDTLRDLVDGYRDSAELSGVAIEFVSELGDELVRFDPKLLPRAVRNVLENALRASEGRGEVELILDARRGSARIRALDSGPGVEPESLSRIFEPYFSTHDSGTGLGLAITRRIVEEHGGDIEAENRAGGGLAVTITIPLAGSLNESAASRTETVDADSANE